MIAADDARRQALHGLAGPLRGQGYAVAVESHHLTVTDDEGRRVEVWAQKRASDGGRLWFVRAGGFPICEADRPMDAIVAVKGALAEGGDR
ncbi:hypothetical protein SAMN04489712_12436 [Thermomonospora echinospora]|uniref:Uncharacterized protein n=1 Tax=Thermomonospora echinospora TaxID=1992 RepID=A0A1H6DWS0_9ACTN|nr:hypothetical protein [Thermomonospora echinospora]SEG89708.1 hypothetical protein SAMN04489712_12436 [Thermomonospora echinospora]